VPTLNQKLLQPTTTRCRDTRQAATLPADFASMVLPSLFTKSSKKSKSHTIPNLAPRSPASSNPGTPPSSPDKTSHSRVKDRERTSTTRRSSSYSSRRSSKYDDDSHPLNLPPEQRKRFSHSAMSAMADQQASTPTPQPMDIDRDMSSSPAPAPAPSSPATTAQPPPSKTNGINGHDDSRPAPPPHRYTTSPPPQGTNYAATPEAATPPVEPPTIDAEEYKAAGNKFFKIKDYPAAIKEYSRGALF
jgi:DnaJ family protein C protein 7